MVQLTPGGKYFSSSAMRVLTAVAAASALPEGDNCTPMPVAGLPFRRAVVAYDWAPSSMRATSLRRTVEPSALARSTMSPNSLVELICPGTTTVAEMLWPLRLGNSPRLPADTCAFCAWIALATSAADRLKPCSLAGSTHTRMARSAPNSCTWPMPGKRCSSGTTLRAA